MADKEQLAISRIQEAARMSGQISMEEYDELMTA